MSAVVVDIAKAVKADLAAATLSAACTVDRGVNPHFDPTTATQPMVYVVVPEWRIALNAGTRDESQEDNTVVLGIYGNVTRDPDGKLNQASVDAMSEFVQSIADFLKAQRSPTDYSDATLMEIDCPAAYDPDMLEQQDVFFTVLRLTYELMR